jgi:hypothetical protein
MRSLTVSLRHVALPKRAVLVASLVLIVAFATQLGQAEIAGAARGSSCGSIAVKNVRDGATHYRVYRQGGSCKTARAVMRRWAANTYRTARRDNCANSTCSNAPAPPGYRCRNGTAGEEITSGFVQLCRRGSRAYRSYSR